MAQDNFKEIFDMVGEFNAMRDPAVVDRKPSLIPPVESALAVNLIKEELQELEVAIDEADLVEIADALADLQYVLCGAVMFFGLHGVFSKIFAEVHRNNMERYPSQERRGEFMKRLLERFPDGDFSMKSRNGRVFAQAANGKILKPHGLRPNLEPIIKKGQDE